MKFLSLLLVAFSMFAISCERHDFEGADGTKQLHEKHGAHKPSTADVHGEKAAH